jgi:1-acyl-sn-glycerol-3-phosphate acyltransferase
VFPVDNQVRIPNNNGEWYPDRDNRHHVSGANVTIHSFFSGALVVMSTPVFAVAAIMTAIFDKTGRGPHWVARLWARFVIKACFVRVVVQGREHLDPEGAYVLACNHSSLLDIPVMLSVIPVQIRWMAKAELFKIPIFGWSMTSAQYIPIDRKSPREWVRSLNRAAERVQAGSSLVVFPEGTRSDDGRIHEFKRGGIEVAVRAGAAVVPVSISGASTVLPARTLTLKPGRVKIVFDKPLPTAGLDRKEQDALMNTVRSIIIANHDPDFI